MPDPYGLNPYCYVTVYTCSLKLRHQIRYDVLNMCAMLKAVYRWLLQQQLCNS